MEKEIINLETSPKIGVIESLSEGISKFFTNFGSFFKMLLPVVYLYLGTAFLYLMCVCAVMLVSVGALNINLLAFFAIFAIFIIILGSVIFGWGFWEYLTGMIAVSYLAKDIYENKPVQRVSDYYSYVKQYSKKYFQYWMVNALISVIWLCVPCLLALWATVNMTKLSVIVSCIACSLIYMIFTLPLLLGLSMSKYFWAYQDKEKPYEIIKKSIEATYKNFFPILGFLFLLNAAIFGIEILLGMLYAPLSAMFSIIAAYFAVFVTTRYYFEILKS